MNAIIRLAATLLRANQSIVPFTNHVPCRSAPVDGRSCRRRPASGMRDGRRRFAGRLTYLRVSSDKPGLSARMRDRHHVNVSRAALTASAMDSIAGASAAPVMNS